MNRKLAGNLAMSFSKICSGLNQNALRYLQPAWMDAFSGVFLRLVFAGVAFWLIGMFTHGGKPSTRDKLKMIALGAILVYGYMMGLLLSLTYTTPVSASLILCLVPVWVLILNLIFFSAPVRGRQVLGISLGMIGCAICILGHKSGSGATNPLLGDCCALGGSFFYAIYILASRDVLERVDDVTFNKWLFLGGAISACAGVSITGFYAPVLEAGLFSAPMAALLFVLIFPSTVSYLLMAIGIRDLSATAVAIYGYVILIVAMIASYLLGQDEFSWLQMLAVALIVVSVWMVESVGSKKGGPVRKQSQDVARRSQGILR